MLDRIKTFTRTFNENRNNRKWGDRLPGLFLVKSSFLLLGGLTAVLSSCSAAPVTKNSPVAKNSPIAWVYRDKIRMGWTPERLEQYRRMAKAGMNAVMPRHELDVVVDYDPAKAEVAQSPNDAKMMQTIRDESRLSKQLGLRYFHSLNLAAQSQTYTVGFQDNAARFNDGTLPSPVDPVYWNRVIVNRVRRVMSLLQDRKTYALDGIIIDPEMYALKDALPGHVDYGKYAFETFLQESKTPAPATKPATVADRQTWIAQNNLQDKYQQWQFNRIRDLARELERTVHRSRPELILGYIIYEDKMWFHAMAAGLSTPQMPVFIGPESTYSGVMDQRMIEYLAGIRQQVKVPTILVPGVWMMLNNGKAPLDFLNVAVGNVYQRCRYSEGYWVYAIYTFGETDEQQNPFFAALKRINDALDAQARTGRLADLKAQPLPIQKPAAFDHLLASARTWKALPDGTPAANRPVESAKLRGSFSFLLWPNDKQISDNQVSGKQNADKQTAKLSLSAIQLGVYLDQCEATLLDGNGQLIWRDFVPINRTTELEVPANPTKLIGAIVGAGNNAFAVQGASCPMVIAPDDFLTLNANHGPAGRFYFYVPPGRTNFKISLMGYGGEIADYTLYDPANAAVLEVGKLAENVTRDVTVTTPGVWCVEVDNVVDDAGFKLEDLPNIFALRAADLRLPPDLKLPSDPG